MVVVVSSIPPFIREPLESAEVQMQLQLRVELLKLGAATRLYMQQKAAVEAMVTNLVQQHTRLDA